MDKPESFKISFSRRIVRDVVVIIIQGHVEQICESEGKPVVLGLIVKFKLPVLVSVAGRNAVVLRDPDAPAQDVAGLLAYLEREGSRVDDFEAAVGGNLGPLLEALYAVGALREVVGAFRRHLELEAELAVGEEEVRHGPAPRAEADLGLLYEDVEGVRVLLHEAEEVDVLAADLGRALAVAVVLFALGLLVTGRDDQGDVHVKVIAVLDAADELFELILEVLAPLRKKKLYFKK